MSAELGVKFSVAASSEELCGQALAVPLGAWIVLVAKGSLASAGRGFPQMEMHENSWISISRQKRKVVFFLTASFHYG